MPRKKNFLRKKNCSRKKLSRKKNFSRKKLSRKKNFSTKKKLIRFKGGASVAKSARDYWHGVVAEGARAVQEARAADSPPAYTRLTTAAAEAGGCGSGSIDAGLRSVQALLREHRAAAQRPEGVRDGPQPSHDGEAA